MEEDSLVLLANAVAQLRKNAKVLAELGQQTHPTETTLKANDLEAFLNLQLSLAAHS